MFFFFPPRLHEIESSCCIHLLHLCQPLFFFSLPEPSIAVCVRSPPALHTLLHPHTHTHAFPASTSWCYFFFLRLSLSRRGAENVHHHMICWQRDSSGTPTHKERPGFAHVTHLFSVSYHCDQYLTAIHSMCGQQEGWGLRRRRPHHCCPLLLSHRSLSFLSFLPFLFPPRFVCHCSLFPSCHVED